MKCVVYRCARHIRTSSSRLTLAARCVFGTLDNRICQYKYIDMHMDASVWKIAVTSTRLALVVGETKLIMLNIHDILQLSPNT
ncbi:unnamed protein product [Sphagnum balticum]